jgi:MinD-like ATPase involved in chromosome partitioning or flagellar assembly
MAIDKTKIREFPPISITINSDDGGELLIGATRQAVTGTDETEVRRELMGLVVAHARTGGSPVRVTTRDQDGIGVLLVSPEGEIEEEYAESLEDVMEPVPAGAVPPRLTPAPTREERPAPEPAAPAEGTDSFDSIVRTLEEPAPSGAELTEPAPSASSELAPSSRREARRSFLTEEQVEEPASQDWRGFLTGLGIRMSPGEAERAERADVQLVSQHWPGPRTIAVVNGRGGAAKTMTTIGLSATFARYGGAGVLAEDNNQTRGTLGWRTEKGPHDASLLDLLPRIDRLLSPSAQAADLAHYVHHQTRDRYDVLRSRPELLASDQRFDAHTVDQVHAVATKYYRLILIDSGNDESDGMWVGMIHHADQIVVPTTTRRDSAESAALLLDALYERGGDYAELAKNAVVIVSQENPTVPTSVVAEIAEGFKPIAREVVTMPFDPAMKDGLLTYGSLRPATRRAWLAAGAAVAKGL